MTAADAAPGTGARNLQLKIGGMSCSFCTGAIARALSRQRGVVEVHVSLAHEEALIRYRPEEIEPGEIARILRSLGYLVRDPHKVAAFEEEAELHRRERRDLFSAACFALLLVAAMAGMWLGLWPMRPWQAWVAWAIASYVFFWNGRRIIRMAWGAARRGITNQHLLLAIGAIGGYLGGLLGTSLPVFGWQGFAGFPPIDFFAVVVFLTTYHLLSGYVSLLVRTKASQSVQRLLALQPETATVLRDGGEREVPIEEVVVGDLVRVRPGERLPVDGIVEAGRSAVDQALVTGEPMPEEKVPGAEVIGGSVSLSGMLTIRVTRTGEQSFLRQVARHVEEAKAMKPGIIVLVDRVLRFYVPAILGVAGLAFLFWSLAPIAGGGPGWVRAIYAGVTVLVMGYPCALGMATPLALVRGGGAAAERGILIRSGEAFQLLKDITHVAFDKTGTLTEGRPRLVAVEPAPGFDEATVLAFAAAAEIASEHPLAGAVRQAAEEKGIALPPATAFEAFSGRGVTARVDGRSVLLGTSRLLAEKDVACDALAPRLEEHEDRARTVVLLAVDGRLAGLLAFADTVKEDARRAVAALRDMGIAAVLLTGDNRRTAEAVAAEVGISRVHAGLLPQDKVERVRRLQAGGARVAMVGDGINDAPALMQAHVGMAIGAGTDIAIEAADVVLVGRRLLAVPEAVAIGGASYRKTVENLWLAFLFNGVGVPLAATGVLHPAWAMAAMVASVSAVLANSFGGRLTAAERMPRPEPEDGPSSAAELLLEVEGMHCRGCAATIEAALRTRGGVLEARADHACGTVRLRHDPARISAAEICDQLARIGYRAQPGSGRPRT